MSIRRLAAHLSDISASGAYRCRETKNEAQKTLPKNALEARKARKVSITYNQRQRARSGWTSEPADSINHKTNGLLFAFHPLSAVFLFTVLSTLAGLSSFIALLFLYFGLAFCSLCIDRASNQCCCSVGQYGSKYYILQPPHCAPPCRSKLESRRNIRPYHMTVYLRR